MIGYTMNFSSNHLCVLYGFVKVLVTNITSCQLCAQQISFFSVRLHFVYRDFKVSICHIYSFII